MAKRAFQEKICFRWGPDKRRKSTKPAGKNSAVYLLVKERPIHKPMSSQCNQWPDLMALAANKRERVQKNSKGTSGVVFTDTTDKRRVGVVAPDRL